MGYVLCPIVVGRANELDALFAALDQALAGRGQVVFLVGEAGIGKSRLTREVAAAGRARGAQVLHGRAVPGSAQVAFRPLTEALGAASASGAITDDELVPWVPALAAMLPGLGRPVGGPPDDTAPARGEAVVRLLRVLLAETGGVLILEDLHWADPETVAVLEHLVDHLERAPVLCVASVRAEEPSPARALARAVASRRTAPVLELGRLDDAQVAAMVQACTEATDAVVVTRVTAAADGVPFLVEELLASPGVPTSFAETMQRRLDQLADDDRAVLAVAAAMGREFDWRLLTTATGLSDAAISDGLERAVGVQLLAVDGDGFRFRHALTRDAVLETLVPPRRQAVAAAALLAVETAHPELEGNWRSVAAELAEKAGQPRRAAELLIETGTTALARGALSSAIAALVRARSLLSDGPESDPADGPLVEAYALAGRVDDAFLVGKRLIERLRRAGALDAAASVYLRLARAAIAATRWPPAERELDQARGLIAATEDGELSARLAVLDAELALVTDDPARARERVQAALAAARQAELTEVTCEALLLQGRCDRLTSLADAQVAFSHALSIAEANDLPVWRLKALHELGTISMLDRGDLRELLAAHALAKELGAMSTTAVLDLELGAGWSVLGDVEAMARHASAAGVLGRQLGLGLVVASAELWHAQVAAMLGDHERARRSLLAVQATGENDRSMQAMALLGVEAVCALVQDDRPAARAAMDEAMVLIHELATALPAAFRGLWPLLLAVDGDEAAEAAIEEFGRSGAMVTRVNRGYLSYARAAIAGRHGTDAATEFAEGERDLAHAPFWHYLGRRLLAEAALTDGWGKPEQWLREAEDWLGAHGYAVLASSCALARRPGDRRLPSRWVRLGVTTREADVLGLVAQGLANKEIAAELGISSRTVEKHVESLLRKTGTRSRTQLVALSGAAT